jgi:CubicO group peptidase (beta-lactamase class C family)/dienelactone hydrolase
MPGWRSELNGMGVATFIVDSFGGRGIKETATDQSRLATSAMIVDAYRALALLATHPAIDRNRIAVMGFSKGGAVALYSSLTRFQRDWGPPGLHFAAHLPFYPSCGIQLLDEERVSAPIRIFHGAADDWTPVGPCREYVERLARAGVDAKVHEFAGALHGFDVPTLPASLYLPGVQNGRRCGVREQSPGIFVDAATGAPLSERPACVTYGATVGYQARAHREAVAAVKEFLAATFESRGAARAASSTEAPWADRALTLPSGATLKVPAEWTATAAPDGVILTDPERTVRIDLVEVDATGGLSGAIAMAWSRRYPGFNRDELAASDSPGREGWDLFRWSRYKTSPEESRRVSAFGAKKGPLGTVVLVDAPLARVQRRASQVALVHDSLRPAGYVRETYRGRAPRPLDAPRVEEMRRFIERMRHAADVPGTAVVLFDANATLIEEGFGVRERGRPEPVTADSLFLIASNTKPLTTLLLARLVDEGRFDWDTPVTRIVPGFRTGDPDTTRRILVRHLVCACTGFPRQDLEWLFTFDRSSPQGQLDLLGTMKPTTDFGALFQYSNPLASAAGYIGARLLKPDLELGQAYDAVMREKVFHPLGMSRTTFSFQEALGTDHARPHSWDMSLKSVPIEMALNRSIVPVRPAGGAWSSARDYARYVRLELARGRLPDGSTFVTEKVLLARRVPQVRVSEDTWYGMGLWIEDVKDIRVISHGGSMFGYKSNFFFVPDAGIGGVILTNADSGWRVARAVIRRTLEVAYDGKPEAEEDLLAGARETEVYLRGEQQDWKVPPDPSELTRLAHVYRNAALGDIVVHAGKDEVIFQFGGWKSPMATKRNPDGTTSFISVAPGIRGFEFNAPAATGVYTRLRLRDAQHTYDYESVDE